jgi:uncharacterized protein
MVAELKVVMFTDQVKSTSNTALRTHAEVDQIAHEQASLTNEVLCLLRGTLLKDTGDGCFAQFLSVLNAVQAGMLLQQRVAERNATQHNERMRFELHIGIDVGELVVFEDGDLRGDAANRCARICSECAPGEIYLSDVAAGMLKKNEVELEVIDTRQLKGIEVKTKLHRVSLLHVWPQRPLNPFVWRRGITRVEDFFDRDNEQRMLRAYLYKRQNCQIVGMRRMGKTSLLRQVEHITSQREENRVVAYLDLQDPRCFTLLGWLDIASRQCKWSTPVTTLADFAENAERALLAGRHLVLCLDEYEELTSRRSEFTHDFFMMMRSCSQQGISIITASQKPLSELTEHSDPSSPFYNTFPLLRLGPFTNTDAEDFVNIYRPGIPSFEPAEKDVILDFAKGHPLALQVACFHVLEAKQTNGELTVAMQKAADDMKAHLPVGG